MSKLSIPQKTDITNFNKAIGANLRRVRQRLNITQTEIARDLEISRTAYTNMEQGRQNFYAHRLKELSDILDCSVVELWPRELKW